MPVVAAAAPPTTAVLRKSRRPKFCSVMASSRVSGRSPPDDVRGWHSMRRPAAADKAARRAASMRCSDRLSIAPHRTMPLAQPHEEAADVLLRPARRLDLGHEGLQPRIAPAIVGDAYEDGFQLSGMETRFADDLSVGQPLCA